jgi:hypothetical protein
MTEVIKIEIDGKTYDVERIIDGGIQTLYFEGEEKIDIEKTYKVSEKELMNNHAKALAKQLVLEVLRMSK